MQKYQVTHQLVEPYVSSLLSLTGLLHMSLLFSLVTSSHQHAWTDSAPIHPANKECLYFPLCPAHSKHNWSNVVFMLAQHGRWWANISTLQYTVPLQYAHQKNWNDICFCMLPGNFDMHLIILIGLKNLHFSYKLVKYWQTTRTIHWHTGLLIYTNDKIAIGLC